MTANQGKPMTPEEKKAQMRLRNLAICEYYEQGHKLRDCASQFRLSRQLVLRILKQHNVWKPYEKTDRTRYVGVVVKPETKDALQKQAEAEGTSVSKFVSDRLDEMVKS